MESGPEGGGAQFFGFRPGAWAAASAILDDLRRYMLHVWRGNVQDRSESKFGSLIDFLSS